RSSATARSVVGSVKTDDWSTLRRERALVAGAEAGDRDASRKLVEAFLPAILGVAGHFPTAVGVERQELVQEGVAGLLFAARRFDGGRGTPFWSYASFWVRKAMQELVAELTRPVALSDRAVRALAQLRAASRPTTTSAVRPGCRWRRSRAFRRPSAGRGPCTSRSARTPRRSGTRSPTPSRNATTNRCSTGSSSARCATWPTSSTRGPATCSARTTGSASPRGR